MTSNLVKDGKVVNFEARVGEEILKFLFNTDEIKQLGKVAIFPSYLYLKLTLYLIIPI